MQLNIKKALYILIFVSAFLLFLPSCSTIDNSTFEDTSECKSIVKEDSSSFTDSSEEVMSEKNWSPTDEDASSHSYLEPNIQIYYVGDCSSDNEAIERLDKLLQIEEDAQQLSGYTELPIVDNFYVVLDTVHDDSVFMEKMSNNDVHLTEYSNVKLNGRKVNITVARYQ